MNGIKRLIGSLTKRGVKRTLQSAISISEDYLFDWRYATDTTARVPVKNLHISSSNKAEAHDYVPTRGRAFRKLMESMSFPKQSVFVDFGSGKGKLLLLASRYSFKRVVGIEFSDELCEIARRNFAAHRDRVRTCSEVEIVCSDVVDYKIKHDENIFFLFNPFGRSVMRQVLANIQRSYELNPRPLWLVYADPFYGDLVATQTRLKPHKTYFYGGYDFIVYACDTL